MGEGNEEGESIVDFVMAFDMALMNTFFMKKDYVTYRSGGRESQIDFLLCRRKHLKEVKDCKVVYGENVSQQHKLVVGDISIRKGTKGKRQNNPKIKWWELEKAENVELLEDDVNDWWETNSRVILRHGEEILGKT